MKADIVENIPLATLMRIAGQKANFAILSILSRHTKSPTELAKMLDKSRTSVRNRLAALRKHGFVTYTRRGNYHHYTIREPLPTVQHQLLLDLIEIDKTDPEATPFPTEDPIDEDTRNRLQELRQQVYQTRLELMESYIPLPGGAASGRRRDYLRDKIQRLEENIDHLEWGG